MGSIPSGGWNCGCQGPATTPHRDSSARTPRGPRHTVAPHGYSAQEDQGGELPTACSAASHLLAQICDVHSEWTDSHPCRRQKKVHPGKARDFGCRLPGNPAAPVSIRRSCETHIPREFIGGCRTERNTISQAVRPSWLLYEETPLKDKIMSKARWLLTF